MPGKVKHLSNPLPARMRNGDMSFRMQIPRRALLQAQDKLGLTSCKLIHTHALMRLFTAALNDKYYKFIQMLP